MSEIICDNSELEIITPLHPKFDLLREKSHEVKFPLSEEDQKIICQMKEYLENHDAFGLAAVQIGTLKRYFVMAYQNRSQVYINPEIISRSGKKKDHESCLSLPGVNLFIERSREVTLRYFNEQGEEKTQDFIGTWARVVQHEIDHANGKLLLDFMS